MKALDSEPGAAARLEQRLSEPSLADVFAALLERRSLTVAELYQDGTDHTDVLDLAEALLDHDEGFRIWRVRHVEMVERQIGDKPGTGGSTGVKYLQSTLGKRFFPELWQVRSQL